MEHKKNVSTRIAWVLGQLANMEFKATGSITAWKKKSYATLRRSPLTTWIYV